MSFYSGYCLCNQECLVEHPFPSSTPRHFNPCTAAIFVLPVENPKMLAALRAEIPSCSTFRDFVYVFPGFLISPHRFDS